jgi:hypothetical protein
LAVESEVVFTLSGAWTTTGLLDKSKINYVLIKGDRSRDKVCNSMDVCVSVLIQLVSLTMCIESLIDGKEQQMMNWSFA